MTRPDDWAAREYARAIADTVARAPELTDTQRARLCAIFHPVAPQKRAA